jgi:predicted DNA-binding protein
MFEESDNGIIVVPMIIPKEVFKFLNDAALRRGKTAAALVNEALKEKIEKLADEDLKGG